MGVLDDCIIPNIPAFHHLAVKKRRFIHHGQKLLLRLSAPSIVPVFTSDQVVGFFYFRIHKLEGIP